MADVAGIRTGLSLVCSVLLCPPFCGSVGGLGWLNISGQNTRPTLSPAHLGKVRNQCHASMALLWCSAVFRFPLIFPHFFFLFFFLRPSAAFFAQCLPSDFCDNGDKCCALKFIDWLAKVTKGKYSPGWRICFYGRARLFVHSLS